VDGPETVQQTAFSNSNFGRKHNSPFSFSCSERTSANEKHSGRNGCKKTLHRCDGELVPGRNFEFMVQKFAAEVETLPLGSGVTRAV
jgi:hypothetical protein